MGGSAHLVLIGGSFLITFSAFVTHAAGVIWIVGESMHPTPAHDVGKVHTAGGTRGRMLGNGCSNHGNSESRVLGGYESGRHGRRHGCDGMGTMHGSQQTGW